MFIANNIRSTKSLGSNDIFATLDSYTKANDDFTLKIVFIKNDGRWNFLSGKIGRDDSKSSEDVLEYSDYLFYKNNLNFKQLKEFIQSLEEPGNTLCRKPELKIMSVEPGRWEWELVPSHATKERYPARRFSVKLAENSHIHDTPLIGFGKKFYCSVIPFIGTFLDTPNLQTDNSSISGSLILDLYDFRHRILTENNRLAFEAVESSACLVGSLPSNSHVLLKQGQEISIGDDEIFSSEIFLISPENKILDYRSHSTWQHRIEKPDEENDKIKKYLSVIKEGEGLHCEFKSFIDLKAGSNKATELEKTVCAMSNAEGGLLLIGVNDDGVITGVTDKVTKVYNNSPEDALGQYCSDIQKRITETLKINRCCEIEYLSICAKEIIIVSIFQCAETNYLLNQEQAYIRRGATSAKLPFIDNRKSNPLGVDYF